MMWNLGEKGGMNSEGYMGKEKVKTDGIKNSNRGGKYYQIILYTYMKMPLIGSVILGKLFKCSGPFSVCL